MGNTKDLDVVMEFINRINAGDSVHLSELMTEDHLFQDALGKRFVGRDKMAAGWREYFKMVGDYKIRPDEFFQTNSIFAIFGSASGSYTSGSLKPANGNFWEVPAAWRAVIRDGRVAEWRVYADNQPLRKLAGDTIP
jgi:hypothetical protein